MRYLIVIETDEGTLNCWAQTEPSARLICQLLARASKEIVRITVRDEKRNKTIVVYGETAGAQ